MPNKNNHRDTENAEVAQRNLRTRNRLRTHPLPRSGSDCIQVRFLTEGKCLFVVNLRCHAEDAPQSVVELEGRLRAVKIIARHTTCATGAVHRDYVHVIRCAMTLLGSLPLREWIVADLGRIVDVRLLLPDVSVNLEHIVTRVTI